MGHLVFYEWSGIISKVDPHGVSHMNMSQIIGVYEVEQGVRKVEINVKRVVEWVLIFTNLFYVSYFVGKLLKIF